MPGIRISLVLRWMTSGYAGRVSAVLGSGHSLCRCSRCGFLDRVGLSFWLHNLGTAYLEPAILPPIYESRLFRFADRPPTRIGCIIIN